MISTPTLPDRPQRVITPAQADEYAINAHQLRRAHIRRTPLGPVMEIRCSCGDLIADQDGDEAFNHFCIHGVQACEAFRAQLVTPGWLDALTAIAALSPDDARLGAAIAAQAALGTVTPPADDSTAVWLETANPLDLDDAAPCGCVTAMSDVYGHQLDCTGGAR